MRLILLGSALLMAQAAAQAQLLPLPPRPPELLEFATDTVQRQSAVGASSSFYGSQRSPTCTSSWAFWECRSTLDASDWNWVRQSTTDSSPVSAERDDAAFGPGLDTTPATSQARARTLFGANLAQAQAVGGRSFIETRVQGAGDGSVSTLDGFTNATAFARSLYTETMLPNLDGPVTLQFDLLQHAGSANFTGSTWPSQFYEGWGEGRLLVQVFNLDQIIDYWLPDSVEPIQGPAIVASDDISRDGSLGSGSSFMSLTFEATAGARYAVVSQLRVNADENAAANFYGTATLQSILVAPGMQLQFGSGTAYAVTAVPEPGTWLLMLAGLGALASVLRRQG